MHDKIASMLAMMVAAATVAAVAAIFDGSVAAAAPASALYRKNFSYLSRMLTKVSHMKSKLTTRKNSDDL